MKPVFAYTAVILVMFLSGCQSLFPQTKAEAPADPEKMYEAAEKLFDQKKYLDAIDMYGQLKSAHPEFKEMPKVYQKIADAYFDLKDYEKAIGAYLQFSQLFPNHADVQRARFQIASAYFNQIRKTDLDSRVIQKAAESFKAIADDPNAGEWAAKAEEKNKECKKKLAEKEMYKAKTYMSMSNYQAARIALRRIQDDFGKLGYDDEVSELLKKIKNK